jgi:hypothetical protein
LPVAVGVPVLAAWIVADRLDLARATWRRTVAAVVAVAAAASQLAAHLAFMTRVVVGYPNPWWKYLTGDGWRPPLSVWVLLVWAVAATAAYGAVLWVAGSGARRAPSLDLSRSVLSSSASSASSSSPSLDTPRVSHSDTCVVIPVFNEDQVIAGVVEEVLATFDHVVCVDDGSTDQTFAALEKTGARIVRHPTNLGQGAALQTGIDYALADPNVRSFVTYDADGQHQVDDASQMVDLLDSGEFDIVFGSRFLDQRTEIGWAKRAVLKLAVRYTNATTGVRLSDAHNGLRAFDRAVAERLDIRMNGMAHASEIVATVARAGFRYTEVPVHIVYSDYAMAKGQSLLNSVNILFDLFFR